MRAVRCKRCVKQFIRFSHFKSLTAKHIMLTILLFVKQAIFLYEVLGNT